MREKIFGYYANSTIGFIVCEPIDQLSADRIALTTLAQKEGLILDHEENGTLFFKAGPKPEAYVPVKLTKNDWRQLAIAMSIFAAFLGACTMISIIL